MNIALMDVDGHNWPNLPLMKLSAWHKSQGDHVEWWNGFAHYDRLYMSKVFTDEYTPDELEPVNADVIIRGGTGYNLNGSLPNHIEHMYPDYSLYPKLTKDTAYGFLTRGCPRACAFCLVADKEGYTSQKVADLAEFWRGQKLVKLLDPNLLACSDHHRLLEQLVDSGAWVDFTQGLDVRLITYDNMWLLNQVKCKTVHFAWDNPNDDLTPFFIRFNEMTNIKDHRRKRVYVLTNFNSSQSQDLHRIYTLRALGYSPYVMIYNKPCAPQHVRNLQRWCNNPRIMNTQPDFAQYKRYV